MDPEFLPALVELVCQVFGVFLHEFGSELGALIASLRVDPRALLVRCLWTTGTRVRGACLAEGFGHGETTRVGRVELFL